MSFLEISNDVLVISITLIGSNPATHGDLETSLLDEVSDLGLHLMCLSGVPHVEILHLNICENFRRILNELKHHSIKYSLNSLSDLDPSLLSCEVIIVSLQPPNIIVSVWHHMDGQLDIWVDPWLNLDFRHFDPIHPKPITQVDLLLLLIQYLFLNLLLALPILIERDGIDIILREVQFPSLGVYDLIVRPQRSLSGVGCEILPKGGVIGPRLDIFILWLHLNTLLRSI